MVKMDARILIMTDYLSNLFDPEERLNEWMIRLQTASVVDDQQDLHLEEKLLAELPGILNWALEGYFRLRARGYFQDSPAERQFRQLDNLPEEYLGNFVARCCHCTADVQVPCQELYDGYRRWASSWRCSAMGRTQFYHAFSLEFPDCTRTKVRLKGASSSPQWIFNNIGWKPQVSFRQNQNSQTDTAIQIQDKCTAVQDNPSLRSISLNSLPKRLFRTVFSTF